MCRKLALSLGAATLLVSLGAGELSAQFNPNGWIQTDGWNYLMPLTQNGSCGGGGEARMQGNWITPHVIGVENPKAGTSYFNPTPGKSTTKIDFPNTEGTTGWGGAGLVADPTWVSNDFVETAFKSQVALAMPNGDVVDYDAIELYLNANLVPTQPGPPPALTLDEILGLATTYVENKSGAPMEVEVCTASDDSIQVWVNNVLTSNVSACRGTGGGCDDSRTAILPPGISKIATIVWEGGGGFGFRLGLRLGGVLITDATAGAANLAFLGNGVGSTTTVGQLQYSALRSTFGADPAFCVDTGTTSIRVQGSGPGAPGDLLTVIEEVTGNLGTLASPNIVVSNISDGGVLAQTLSPDFGGTAITALPNRAVVGTTAAAPCGTLMNTTDNGGGSYTSVSDSGTDIWDGGDSFEFGYEDVTGDFDISIEMTAYAHAKPDAPLGRWGKFGLMARQDLGNNSRYTMAQSHGPQDDDGARQAGRTVHNVSNTLYETPFPGMPPRPRFLRLTRRGNVVTAWASQDARLADGTINPCNDANWTMGRPDDWGGAAPATISVGFANSEHNDQGCGPQTVTFRLLPCSAASPPIAKETITWTGVPRSTITDTGVTFDISTASTLNAVHSGKIIDTSVTGGVVRTTSVGVPTSGPVGIFDDSLDIGFPATAGSTTFSAGVYTQTGSGNDIWDGGDQFQYAYQRVTGDFVATARILTRVNPVSGGRWGKHGLMARWTCHQNSKYSMIQEMLATVPQDIDTPRHAFRINHLQNDTNRDYYQVDDGTFADAEEADRQACRALCDPLPAGDGCRLACDATAFPITRLPPWQRMIRRGDTIYTYLAEDVDANGSPDSWCLVGSDSAPNMPDEVLVGMALTSHAGAQTGTITYDNMTIEALDDCGDSVCTTGEELAAFDFTAPDGTDPALGGAIVVVGGTFAPVIMGNRLRLTVEGVGGSANAVWSPAASLGDTGFVAEFDAYMSHSVLPGDANPADGMTFAVVQGDAGLAAGLRGDGGGALGFEGFTLRERTECHPSFSVELDNWIGGGEPSNETGTGGSPNNDGSYHVGLNVNASVGSIQTNEQFGVPVASLPNIFDADGVHVEVQYSASGHVNVYVSDGTVPRTQVISACINPLAGDLLIGFTAGTGGATATQEVDNLVISSVCCEDADTVTISGDEEGLVGTPVVLTANAGGVDGAATYTWSIESGPGNITPSGNTASVDATGAGDVVVKVVFTDGTCGGSAEDTHTISFDTPGNPQKPNDMNGDGNLDISDPVATLNHLFLGGVGPVCGDGTILHASNLALLDANASGAIDISDPVFVLNFLFLGGPTPANCFGDVTCPCIVIPDCPEQEGCAP